MNTPRTHCGASPVEAPAAAAARSENEFQRLDLEALVLAAEKERAYDETVKVRVSQDDIRKLVERRRRKA